MKKVAPMTATVAAQAEERVSGRSRKLRHLQDDRAAAEGERAGVSRVEGRSINIAPGTWVIPSTAASQPIVEKYGKELGIPVAGVDAAPSVEGERLKPNTKVGLYKAAGNMPAGWQMWMLEQWGINHEVMKAQDFAGDLNAKYDVIILPSGTTKARIIERPQRQDQRSGRVGVGVRHR